MKPIVPCLWMERAEEAAEFYTSVFRDARVVSMSRYGPDMPLPEGTVLTAELELNGQPFLLLNGGPGHPFTDAISFQVFCDDQAEIDHYWDGLLAGGGTPVQCGWLTDRFGVSWQVVPTRLMELQSDPDPARAQRAMQAMMGMVKLDIAALEAAADGA
jgi:predicted 3-demethylubiquinone-9 3-methyltransferase (glyoxalase superfamily)